MGKHRKVGLVLGSGAARGIAHIGVIKELSRNNIPVDLVAGSSIGSVVGAYYALYGEIASLEERFVRMKYKDFLRLLDFSRPTRSLIKGDRLLEFFDTLYQGKGFSDLRMPFAAVATDFRTGEAEMITKGRLSKAVRASVSIPGVFSPQRSGKKLLVDGGLVMPTPVEAARMLGAGRIIAVDLPIISEESVAGLNIIESITYSYELLRKRLVPKDKSTVVIRPDFKGRYVGLNFADKSLIEAGRSAAARSMKRIRQLAGI